MSTTFTVTFDKLSTGQIMVRLSSIVVILLSLFSFRITFTKVFTEPSDFPPPLTLLRVICILVIIGGTISLIGGIIGEKNPRNAGIIAIFGAIVCLGNVIAIVGGVFLIQGAQYLQESKSRGSQGKLSMEEMPWTRVPNKRCPECRAEIPGDAEYCPECKKQVLVCQ